MRFELVARGKRSHSGVVPGGQGLGRKIVDAQRALEKIADDYLTLTSTDGWISQIRFPFTQVGTRGIYNITAAEGVLGIEVRPIPEDRLDQFVRAVQDYCQEEGFIIQDWLMDPGIICDPDNPYLQAMIAGVEKASGEAASFGKKLAGTSARFAPRGQGVVWGQSGVGPHSKVERHYIPSIMPYWQALEQFAGFAPDPNKFQ
jgi:acetylornithine deacetylase/succinyl-diaminopimelate desuccinylase-like protein